MGSQFLTPITSGLTPVPGGALNRDRAAELDRRLRELRKHRRRAEAKIRTYAITGSVT